MSSPMDSGIDMKKRKRLAALAKQGQQQNQGAQQTKKEPEAENKAGFKIGGQDCDLGMSPQVMKGGVFSRKKVAGGGMTSPIAHAERFKLGRR